MPGLPLGVNDHSACAQDGIPLLRGDRLLAHTDGVVDAPNRSGGLFHHGSLVDVLQSNAGADLHAIHDRVLQALLAHTDRDLNHDDVTLIAIEVLQEVSSGE